MMRWWGRDPLDILIAQESTTCKGCEHSQVAFGATYCGNGKKYGRRCKSYKNTSDRSDDGKQK